MVPFLAGGLVIAAGVWRLVLAATRAIEAVGAELALGQADGLYERLKLVEFERGEVQLAADLLHHALIFGRIGLGVFLQILILVALEILDDAARDEFHIALAGSEADEGATVDEGRTGNAHEIGRAHV